MISQKHAGSRLNSYMVVFDDDEMEIALCTYNRPNFLSLLIPELYPMCVERNIQLRIVDASSTDQSYRIICSFISEHGMNLLYTRVPSDTLPGYMQMEAISSSRTKYTWVYADARRVDFSEFDKKVFPIIRNGVDFLVFYGVDYSIPDGMYNDVSQFLHDCLVQFTCTGCTIYNRDLFSCYLDDKRLKERCDRLFLKNYAFSWMGYSLYALALKDNPQVYFCKVQVTPVMKKKKSTWMRRFYGCWIDDLVDITDHLPQGYRGTYDLLREVWGKMELDNAEYCYIGRTKGDLNKSSYDHYRRAELLQRAGANEQRMGFYACAPLLLVHIFYPFDLLLCRIKGIVIRCRKKGGKGHEL